MICPHCQGRGELPDSGEIIAARADELKRYCVAQGHAVTFDDLVKQPVAAELCVRSERTLEGWRYGAGPIRPARRNLWALRDIAQFLLDGEQ